MSVFVAKLSSGRLANPDEIKRTARGIVATRGRGRQVVVVACASDHAARELETAAAELSAAPAPRELDMLLSACDQATLSLLAMAIAAEGADAVSFTGLQLELRTSSDHGGAKIESVRDSRLRRALDEGKIAVVSGSQGISRDNDITTLGPDGADAVVEALARSLGADRCGIDFPE